MAGASANRKVLEAPELACSKHIVDGMTSCETLAGDETTVRDAWVCCFDSSQGGVKLKSGEFNDGRSHLSCIWTRGIFTIT